jgi:hypothetical protein
MHENQNKVTNKRTNELRANLLESTTTETKSPGDVFYLRNLEARLPRTAAAEPTRRRSCEATSGDQSEDKFAPDLLPRHPLESSLCKEVVESSTRGNADAMESGERIKCGGVEGRQNESVCVCVSRLPLLSPPISCLPYGYDVQCTAVLVLYYTYTISIHTLGTYSCV